MIERGCESGLFGRDEEKDKDAEEAGKGISYWYRNLSRTNVNRGQRGQVHSAISSLHLVLPMGQPQLPHTSEQPPTPNPLAGS